MFSLKKIFFSTILYPPWTYQHISSESVDTVEDVEHDVQNQDQGEEDEEHEGEHEGNPEAKDIVKYYRYIFIVYLFPDYHRETL